MPAFVVTRAATAEHEPPLRDVRERGDRAGEGRGDRLQEHVAVLDMRELVRDDPLELLAIDQAHEPLGHADHRVLGVPARREGVGLLVRRHRDGRHGEAGPLPQAIDHVIELRGLGAVDDLRAVRPEDHRGRVPVHEDVHAGREDQRHHHPRLTPERTADRREERREPGHEQEDLQVVHCRLRRKGQGAPATLAGRHET